jgi:hypothetical protein
MFKINLQSVSSRFGKSERTRYTHRELHPTREWLIGLALCIGLVAIGAVQSAHQFMQFKNVDTRGGVYEGTPTVYNEAIVSRALTLFSARATTFNELQTSVPIVVEPVVETVAASSSVASSTPDVNQDSDGDTAVSNSIAD